MKKVYGCVACQVYHLETEDLFDKHRFFQSKHGMQYWSEATWAKALLKRRRG